MNYKNVTVKDETAIKKGTGPIHHNKIALSVKKFEANFMCPLLRISRVAQLYFFIKYTRLLS